MSSGIQQYINAKLHQRKEEDNFRSLTKSNGLIDFFSNDYLGFARDKELKRMVIQEIESHPDSFLGSTGSRLLSGNHEYYESLEKFIADFHGAEAALIFNSGFDANYGLLSALPYRGDTIIFDELVHASLHDGIKKSRANSVMFSHNNLGELRQKLEAAEGLKYVVVESVYSMDGDFAPLKQISELCSEYDAGLIVDEAHATGIQGEKGEGRVKGEIPGVKVLARIHTFSKALGAFGAVILCSAELREFLINYCRPLIFSTSLPFHALAGVKVAYQYTSKAGNRRQSLRMLVQLFVEQVTDERKFELIKSECPIQSIVVPGNGRVKGFANQLQQKGFDVRPILYPTVAKGKERIRICLHSFNTREQVTNLVDAINEI